MSDYTVGDTLYFMFTTRRFSTGAPFTLAGTPVVSVYEDAGTTEITAGITLGVDHDSRTGLNLVTVVASGANGYESGKDYHLVITTGTVDSVSVVGEVVGRFTLQKSAAAVDLANGTDGLGAIKTQTAAIEVDTADIQSRLPAALVSGRIDASVGAMAANVMTAAAAAADLTTELQSGLATAAALTTVEGKIDTIDGIVDSILDDTGTSGVVVAAGSKTGYTLTATTGLGNQTANITGSLSGSVGSVTGAVGSVTGNVGGNVTGSVGSVVGAVGSVTGNVGGNVTGSVGSVAAGGITASSIAADAIGASELAADAVAEIADAVWDELLSGHAISGSTGAALSAAGGSGDPWATALPGAYSAGTAGKIIGDNLNATISSRLASASYTAPLDAAGVRTAVGLASANLDTQLGDLPTNAELSTALGTADDAVLAAIGALSIPTADQNADALLKRDWTAVTGEAARSVLNALRFLRNKWSISGGTLTVTEEDDTTPAWTGTVTTAAGNPTTQIDPS